MPSFRRLGDAECAAIHVAREVATECTDLKLLTVLVCIVDSAANGAQFPDKPGLFKVAGFKQTIHPAIEVRLAALAKTVPQIPLAMVANDRSAEIPTDWLSVTDFLMVRVDCRNGLGLLRQELSEISHRA